MTVDGRLLLLDTSVILHLLRGKATGLAIDAAYEQGEDMTRDTLEGCPSDARENQRDIA
jgi:hypothetical protein